MSKKRYFQLYDPTDNSFKGRYSGLTPEQAASKAFTYVIKQYGMPTTPYQLTIRETTRGCEKKTFTYEAERVEMDEPRIRCVGDQQIVNRYMNAIKKVKSTISDNEDSIQLEQDGTCRSSAVESVNDIISANLEVIPDNNEINI